MPYLLMTKSYDYDDQFYYEQDGGYPELVFEDEQRLRAVETLAARRQDDWPECTPLEVYYQEQPLSDFSSSGLASDDLARGVSAVLQEPLSPREILKLDFRSYTLTDEQRRLIGLMLDRTGHCYLEYVSRYQEGV